MKKKYKVVSLFSGGMGLDLGLERTGKFEIIACIEKEQAFCETIRMNCLREHINPKLMVFEGDITNLSPGHVLSKIGLKVGEVDLLVGGPPCQSFSTTGKRKTIQDPRGTLLWQFLRFVEVMQPRFFLMENVRGLLSAAVQHRPLAMRPEQGGIALSDDEKPGSVIRLFANDLQKLCCDGYHMDCFEVNAVNYGAPQLRERAIFIGNRFNAVVDFPQPTHGCYGSNHSLQKTFFSEENLLPWSTLRDAIGDLKEDQPIIMDFSPRKKEYLSLIPPGSYWRSLPIEIQKESMGKAWYAKGGRSGWWRRLNFDLPCPTLVTMPNHASTSLCHPTELRALTLREYARIQEFPDQWEFYGKIHEKYAQIGNAVPVRLGCVAGNVIAQELDIIEKREWKPYPQKPHSYRIVYVQSHVRTRQWFKNGETFVWHDSENEINPTYSPPKTKLRSRNI